MLEVMQATESIGTRIPIDINHSTEFAASEGKESPAVGYAIPGTWHIKSDGSLWADAFWGPRGLEVLGNREYGYISPAFIFEPDPSGKTDGFIKAIVSIGLVNQPNFELPALNAQELTHTKDKQMDPKEIRKALGLAENATEEQVQARLVELDNAAKVKPEPALNAVQIGEIVAKAVAAEVGKVVALAVAPLHAQGKESHDQLVARTIDGYVKAGKIQPNDVSKNYWIGQCVDAASLKRTCEYLDQIPAFVSTNALIKGMPDSVKSILTQSQKRICELLRIKEEDYLKTQPYSAQVLQV
jgi:phage I-like protein